ncbi:MAG: YitT family protein [Clostridiales bacterium]|uniref:YitT family protein n=1 Tax=Terrisporobacter sp. TaxID=1965305 RepID=UPI002A4B3D4D|nr:YitT family protein [Terrisporobacter sp.]MCI5628350.1 YitT family protein [Clostridium sp.]MDD5877919.1 YitT family protein [Clostridiales bacterium]MCI6457725.1 YitT family protein [Clostridium sp.]MCI7208150.1 YitT family protein [Clostridium sp.]MDD7753952.1 YitT family protein [Clostridiales bacterium]
MFKNKEYNSWVVTVLSYMFITIGILLASLALEIFLIPNRIIDGGITGISIILSFLTNINLSIFIIVINIPFLLLGFKHLGKNFLIRTTFAMIIFSFLLEQFKQVDVVTNDVLLATVFGGILLGIGVGFVIRYGACLDGVETIAILINKKTSFSVGQVILLVNLVIYMVAGIVFGWDRALYSIMTYFITYKIIDIVSEGLEQAKSALIITNHGDEIANSIYKKLGRTVTFIEGEGLISGKKVVLYVVVTRIELRELKKIIEDDDVSAFMTITDVSEIVGQHIKKKDSVKNK